MAACVPLAFERQRASQETPPFRVLCEEGFERALLTRLPATPKTRVSLCDHQAAQRVKAA